MSLFSTERAGSLQFSDVDALADELRTEITDFDRELKEFLQDSSSVKQEVASLGSEEDKKELRKVGALCRAPIFTNAVKQCNFKCC